MNILFNKENPKKLLYILKIFRKYLVNSNDEYSDNLDFSKWLHMFCKIDGFCYFLNLLRENKIRSEFNLKITSC